MVTAPCPKAKKPKAKKKRERGRERKAAITSRSIPTKFDKISQVAWTVRRNPHALNMRKRFKLLTVKKKTPLLEWEGERRMQKRCVAEKRRQMCFQGREVQTRRGSQEFLHAPHPHHPTLPPPSMWDLSAWVTLSYLGDKMVSLSLPLFVSLSAPVLPTSTLVCLMW